MKTGHNGQITARKRTYTREELEHMRQAIAPGASEDEMQILLLLARKYSLDPLCSEIWWKQGCYFVAPRALARIMQSERTFDGVFSCLVYVGDDLEVNLESGVLRHHMGQSRGPLAGAWAVCGRADRKPVVCYVDHAQWLQSSRRSPGQDTGVKLQAFAELQAMRRQFDLSELHTEEEWHYDGPWSEPLANRETTEEAVPEPLFSEHLPNAELPDGVSQRLEIMRDILNLGKTHGLSARDLRAMVEQRSPGTRVPAMDVLNEIRARLEEGS